MLVFLLIQRLKAVRQTSYLMEVLKLKIAKDNCLVITYARLITVSICINPAPGWCLLCNELVNFPG